MYNKYSVDKIITSTKNSYLWSKFSTGKFCIPFIRFIFTRKFYKGFYFVNKNIYKRSVVKQTFVNIYRKT